MLCSLFHRHIMWLSHEKDKKKPVLIASCLIWLYLIISSVAATWTLPTLCAESGSFSCLLIFGVVFKSACVASLVSRPPLHNLLPWMSCCCHCSCSDHCVFRLVVELTSPCLVLPTLGEWIFFITVFFITGSISMACGVIQSSGALLVRMFAYV